MKVLVRALPAVFLLLVTLCPARAEEDLKKWELKIDGVTRETLVHAPAQAKEKPVPLVFAFHGHGGNMNSSARNYGYHTLWPEAIVVYPQGLNTAGKLTDPEGKKPGWQNAVGAEGDRDLKFFDALLARLKTEYKVDEHRIYSTGHSNGGGFTYLLWAARGDVFAAMAPSASAAARNITLLKPKPALHVAGENDPLVKFEWQKATIEAVKKINQCGEGQPWDKDKNCTIYPSKIGAPLITAIHPGTHTFPKEAPPVIVKFFKEQVKP
jgi:polyhydroxybutyrate depolymerase